LYPDRLFRKSLGHLVEKIITYTNHNNIFGVKTIKLENGIDPSQFKRIKSPNNLNKLELIGVANLSFWHAYDRLIDGLFEYYKVNKNTYPVRFTVVGEGNELTNLKNKVQSLKLEHAVIFTGKLIGKELDDAFSYKHMGVDLLGMFRRGFNECHSLKAREYCIRGIPFISSTYDSDFEEKFPFRLQLDPVESPIDIKKVISYYKNFQAKYSNKYQSELITFAKENLSWENKIKKISNYF
jgi:glycosyltransferase involved in cell wall biosynthesis